MVYYKLIDSVLLRENYFVYNNFDNNFFIIIIIILENMQLIYMYIYLHLSAIEM